MKTDTLCLLLRKKPKPQIYLPMKKRGFGQGKFVGVGGGVEAGETIPQAAVREIFEETGLRVPTRDLEKVARLVFHFPARPDWTRTVHVFLLRRWQGNPVESDELEPHWFSYPDIPYADMWADAKHWLPPLLQGKKINGEFTFAADNETTQENQITAQKDFLWQHLKALPYFRSLLRSVEASYYQDYDLPPPVYDLGCGDGHFASIAFDHQLDVGLDPWLEPIRQAPKFGAYQSLVVADGAQTPFPTAHFASALSNSVLEHIEHIDEVLADTARILQPGAPFLFCVPNPGYYNALSIPALLRRLGLKRLANLYVAWFGRMSRVHHADWPQVWQDRLEKAGFSLDHYWHYFSPAAMRALEWGHYLGAPSLLPHFLFGRWIISPTRWNLALTERYARRYAGNEHRQDGTFTFFVARRR